MKKILLLLSSMFVLGGNVAYAQTKVASTTQTQDEEKTIEEIDEWFYTDDADYHFIKRGSLSAPDKNKNDYEVIFWVFDFTNISDEPVDVWFTAMNDMEIKVENEYTITDLKDDGIYQIELLDNGGIQSVEGSLSDIDLKPGATITILFYGQYKADENNDDEYYLEFKEWFNSDNSGKIYPYGHVEAEAENEE